MHTLNSEIIVNRNINKCFSLFNFEESNMKLLDPTIIFHTPIKETNQKIGSIYKEARDDNGNLFEIELEIIGYKDEECEKFIEVEFEIEKQLNVKYSYKLEKVEDFKTKIIYTITTTEKSMLTKILLKFSKRNKNDEITKHLIYIKSILES